uniref:Ribosomal eL28/Mak16 domain-containing protein n=1 Tax=Alexandrium andersonii TaxID=327968 RepID=A0A7S2C939_9DINO
MAQATLGQGLRICPPSCSRTRPPFRSPKQPTPSSVAMRVSPDLIWECVKDSSSFIRKCKDAPVMTAEPGNLTGLNMFRFSGLASKKALDVSVATKGKKQSVMLTRTHGKQSKKPGSVLVKTGIKKDAKKGVAAIAKETDGKFYRTDLKDLAVAKYMKIKQSFKKNKSIPARRAAKKPASQ